MSNPVAAGIRTDMLILALCVVSGQAHPNEHPDDYVFNEIVRVRGTVTVLNHPTLGTTPGSSIYLVFRREGCRHCLVATWTHPDGTYELFLGRGNYKLIVRDAVGGGEPSKDLLSPTQERWLKIGRNARDVTFDVDINFPK